MSRRDIKGWHQDGLRVDLATIQNVAIRLNTPGLPLDVDDLRKIHEAAVHALRMHSVLDALEQWNMEEW
jgi:hypothetical protein